MAGELNHTGELLVTIGSGKGLWYRTRPCGALGDHKLRSAWGVRSKTAAAEGERRASQGSSAVGISRLGPRTKAALATGALG